MLCTQTITRAHTRVADAMYCRAWWPFPHAEHSQWLCMLCLAQVREYRYFDKASRGLDLQVCSCWGARAWEHRRRSGGVQGRKELTALKHAQFCPEGTELCAHPGQLGAASRQAGRT